MESEQMIFDGFFAEATTEATAEEGRRAETIKNLILCGLTSKNGRTIPAAAFGGAERAKTLYQGVHVYLNHDIENGPSRKVQELAGIVENVTVDSLGRPRGDIRLNGNKAGDELRELFQFAQKAVKHGARLKDVGMSHVARYTFTSYDRSVVQSVDEVFSVDVVIRPATTKSFSEGTLSVPEKTAAEFLEMIGGNGRLVDRVDFAFGEAELWGRSTDTTPGFAATEVLKALTGHSSEGSKALEGVAYI